VRFINLSFNELFIRMRSFDVEGGRILLVKDDDKFYATGDKCTHYGAPLSKGLLDLVILLDLWI
jgi:hypothetical protein